MSTIPATDIEHQSQAGGLLTGVESDVRARAGINAKIRNWRVIHACEYARDVLPVVEGQVTAGMRPYIVTPHGAGTAELYLSNKELEQPPTLSLLRAWNDVRNWRKSLLECDPENTADIIHAHSFAAGMAAVRGFSCVVYDLCACIEDWAIASGQCDHGSWMGRSFRVAEQFVLSRAEAVIVHSLGMKSAVEERGAPNDSIFLIPEPLDFELEVPANTAFLSEELKIPAGVTTYCVPQFLNEKDTALSAPALAVLEAIPALFSEQPNSVLLVEVAKSHVALLSNHLERLGISDRVISVEATCATEAMREADVVVAIDQPSADEADIFQPNRVCLDALRLGKPLLAADVPRNREATPEGRGCLWFGSDDVRDLSHRMAFLGSNPDFCSALAASGRTWIFETRNSTAVGRKYDEAYRHAVNRKKARTGGPTMTALRPVVSANW